MSLLGCTSDLVDNNSATQQTGVCKEEANVDLDRRLANLGIDNPSFMDSAQPQVEANDDNHGQQCTGLAELSFRIETPGDLGSKLRRLDASMSSLLEKGTEDQADFEAISSAREGQFDVLVLQCKKADMPSKENIPAVNPTPFSHIDEGMDRVLKNGGAVSSDLVVYTPNHNNAVGREVREMSYTDADCIDGKVMKIGGILLRKASFPMQSSRPKVSSLLKRDYQSQVFSRSKYESAKAGCKDKCGTELERAITYPRASQVEKVCPVPTQEREEPVDDEDLYRPPGIHPNQTHNIKTPFYPSDHQKVSRLEEEELHPVLVDDKLALGQGFVGSSFPSQNDLYSHGGKEHFPHQVSSSHLSSAKLNNPYSSNAGAEGYLVDQFDYPSACFAEPHERPHTRFQNFRCHPNEQFAVDLHCSQLPSGNGVCVLPMASHQFTGPSFASRKDISPPVPLNYAPHANTCYNQHACMQPTSYMPNSGRLHFCAPTCTQHSSMSYQPWHVEDQCLQCTSYGRCSMNLPQRGPQQQIHGGAGLVLQSQSHACLARKENCPPLPGLGAPPYVLCQGCHKILQVPDNLRNRSVLQRIRCSACGRISKFCNVLHAQYQALLEDGFKHRSHSLPTRMGLSEKGLAHDVKKVHMPSELDRNLRSSYGYSGQCNRVDKYSYTQGNGTPVSSYDMEKLNSFYHPRLPATMSMGQRPCESEWRYGTNYGLAGSSGIARENYLPFTVNGSGALRNAAAYPAYKMQQSNGRVPNSVSQYAELGQGKEAVNTSRFADNFIQEQRDSRVRVSSGEIQGLSLGCPQEGSRDGSSLIRHADRRSLQQGHGNGVVKNGLNGASCAPAPGSPLHKHLSYDTASDFVEWAHKQGEKGKQTDAELSAQEASKGSKFLSGLLKKNISEFGRGPGSNKNWKVVINGQMLPYAAVKSAEKQAGTIRPGIYWYDYQAGFWGVMGGPCLGIIPPSIAEFNFPLAKECAGGTTGVFVNGRELHKKDLDVLSGRGLPKTCGKAYMVDISGQVIDQASGQLLRSLGRLAPTIERRGRGCGMFQPPTQS